MSIYLYDGKDPSFFILLETKMIYCCERNLGFSLVKGSMWNMESYPDDDNFVRLSRKNQGSLENYCLRKDVFKENFKFVAERGICYVK